MRKVFSVALMAAMVCLVGMTRDAGATVTISLVWTATSGAGTGVGTSAVSANAGDLLTLSVRLSHNETSGIGIHTFSVNFDSDLGDELNLVSATSWLGTTYMIAMATAAYGPLAAGVGPNIESGLGGPGGQIGSYESGTTSTPGLPAGTYEVGTAVFLVTGNAATDGDDLFSGLFAIADGIFNGAGAATINSFGNGAVNLIPEPGTASLLGLGLVGLVLAGRRSRRS